MRNRLSQIRAYVMFCLYAGLPVLPATSTNLCRYLVFLSRSIKSFQTVKNYLDGVRFYQTSHGYINDWFTDHDVSITLRSLRKKLCSIPNRKLPITLDTLSGIYQQMDMSNLVHLTLWAAFLVAFYGFLRKANVVPDSAASFDSDQHLARSSFDFKSNGDVVVTILKSKNNQFQDRKLEIPLTPIPGSIFCPVLALTSMFSRIPAPISSPAFVIPFQQSLLTLTHSAYTAYLHDFLQKAGFNPSLYSGHSFRRGGCTFAAACGVPAHLLKIQGDWSSNCFEQYLSQPLQQRLQVMNRVKTRILCMSS